MELHNETTLTPEILYSVNTRAQRSFFIGMIALSLFIVSFILSVWKASSPDWMLSGIYLLVVVLLLLKLPTTV